MAEMQNIDIRDFQSVQTLSNSDYVVLSLGGGSSAKVRVDLLKAVFTAALQPSIKNGTWYVGEKNLGVKAEGNTPEMRRGAIGIEYKYTTEGDSEWRLLVPYTDIKLQYDALTDAQKQEVFTNVYAQVHDEVVEPVNEAVANMNTSTSNAILKMEGATNSAITSMNISTTNAINKMESATDSAITSMNTSTTNAINKMESATSEAIETINKATESANTATENANKAAEAANKYANRVKDITQEEWEEMEDKGTWEEGVEYNVYEQV